MEMKRQKIQRELMKLEEENMEKREEIVIKKEVGVFDFEDKRLMDTFL